MKRALHFVLFLFLPVALLAQTDVTIGYGESSGGSWSGGNPDVWTSTTWNAKLNAGEIESRLNAGTSVTITTTDGSITDSIGVVIRKTAGGDATLKFRAYGTTSNRSYIFFNYNDSIISTSGKLHLIFNADADGNSDGFISGRVFNNGNTSAGIYFASNGGDIIYGGGSDPATTPAYGYPGGFPGIWLNGVKNIAAGGTISIRGVGTNGWAGVQLAYATTAQTTTADITIVGTGPSGSSGENGVRFGSDSSIIETTDGNIIITGTGGSGTTYGYTGFLMGGACRIRSVDGDITITGNGGSSTYGYCNGIVLTGTSTEDPIIQSVNGTITLNGTAGNSTSGDAYGISMGDGGGIWVTGTGTVNITAVGGTSTYNGHGLRFTAGQSTPGYIHTNTGAITITATGGATTTAGSAGLYLYSYGTNAYINSTTGTISIHSRSISGGDALFMQGDNTSIESGGDISILADRTGTGAAGHGITMSFNPKIKAFGTANIAITATGSSVGTSSCGIQMYSGSPLISSEQGSILITANGGGASGNGNHGIDMGSGASIYAAGSGDVRITSTAGFSGYGLNLAGNTRIQTDSGSMVITGTGTGATWGYGYNRNGGGYGLINNYGDSLSLTFIGSGTDPAMAGYGGSMIGSSTFPGELIIRASSLGADHIALSPFNLTGTGRLTLEPIVAGTTIGLADGIGSFNLSPSDLGSILNGFHRIIIGRQDGSGAMNTYNAIFTDSLELRTGSGNIVIGGDLTNNGGSIDITSGGTVLQVPPVYLTAGSMRLSGSGTFLLHPTVSVLTTNIPVLTVNGAAQAGDTLHLGSTYVNLGGNTFTIGSAVDHPGVLNRTTGMFAGGSLKRWFEADTVSNVLFPVVNDGDVRFANVSFTTAPASGGSVTASFSASAPGTTGFPMNDGVELIAYPSSFGYWTMSAGNGLSGGVYDISFDAANVSFPEITDLHLVKRSNSGAAWSIEGTHAAATAESGPLTRLGRTGLTSFSDFAFGSAIGDSPYLTYSDTSWNESGSNNGRIDNSTPMIITLSGAETFTGTDNDDFVAAGKLTVANLASGLTVVARRTSETTLSVTISGAATAHTAADSVTNVSFTFQNSAFSGNDAGTVIFSVAQGFRLLFSAPYTPHVVTFDGVNDYVNIPSSVAPVRYTVELWVKPAATNNALLFVRTGAGGPLNEHSNELRISNGLFEHFVYDGNEKTVTGTTAVVSGTWYHVAITAENSGMMRLYVNGVEEGSAQSIGALWNGGDRYQIGRNGDNMQWYSGSIDEVRIWDSVRTQPQIAGTMGQELTGTESGLLSYYDFNIGSGVAAYDLGPSAVDAALVNGVAWGSETIGGLVYDHTAFFESTVAPGTIDNTVPMTITLTGTENFTGANGSNFVTAGKVTVTGVPSGLTAVVTRTSAKTALFTLTGTASSHQPANNVASISIQFLNGAFAGANASSIDGSQQTGISVSYLPSVVYRRANGIVTFSKGNYVDVNQAANQDRITNNVWITRGNSAAWYNAKTQSGFEYYNSPQGTEWALGTTDNYANLSYSDWTNMWMYQATSMIGQNMVVHLIADDIYLDIKVLSWQAGGGGAFSYERSALTAGKQLVYTDTSFAETSANDGSIDNTNTAMIALYGDTFTGSNGDDLVAAGKVVVSNVPSGLTPVVTRMSPSIVTLVFTGQAVSHGAAQNDSLVTISFQNSAFTGNHADSIANSTKGAVITFENAFITYDGTVFRESIADGGTMIDTLMLTLSGDAFTGSNGDDLIAGGKATVSNLPAGLTAVLRRTSAETASLFTTGTAAAHAFTNSVTNLTVAFQNSAFAANNASLVTGSNRNDMTVMFDIAKPGNALRFDGMDDHMSLPAGVYFNGDFTVEAWVYEYAYNNWSRVLDFGTLGGTNNVVIALSTDISGQVSMHVFQGGSSQFIQAPVSVPLEQWTHIACVLDNGTATIYYNGVAVVTGSVHSPLNITRISNFIGKSNWPDATANASIDEFRIWDIARSQQEIREGMFRTMDPSSPGLTQYLQFNVLNNTSAFATVGVEGTLNNFNGTASSGPVASSMPAAFGTSASAAAVQSGTTTIGDVTLTMTEAFDVPVEVTTSVLHAAPFNLPGGYTSSVRGHYFIIQPFGTPGTFSADLTLNFGTGNLDSRVDSYPAGIRLFRRASTGFGSWTEVGGAVSASSSTGSATWSGISALGQFVAVYEESALPVELTSFTAAAQRLNAELRWSTATEVNNNGFRLQRKKADTTAAAPWTDVTFVSGNGTTNKAHEYSFTDRHLKAGRYRYRLQQIDNDGRSGFSQEIEVSVGAAPLVFGLSQNYPNPFNPSTTIAFTLQVTGKTTLKVYDAIGREVAVLVNEELEAGVVHMRVLETSHLSAGVYFARLASGTAQKVIKMLLVK